MSLDKLCLLLSDYGGVVGKSMKRVTVCVSAIIVSMTIRLIDGCDGQNQQQINEASLQPSI